SSPSHIPPPPSFTPLPYTTLFRSHDVGVAGGDPQHPWPAGADEQARAALGLGHHVKLQAIGVVPGAGVINPVAGQQSSDDRQRLDRKSTRLNSSHVAISYAVFCLK